MNNNVAVIEGEEYAIATKIDKNGKEYLVLAPVDNPQDIMLREYIKKDGKEYFKKLEIDEEFYEIITMIGNNEKEGVQTNE